MSSSEIGLTILIIYLFTGTILWIIGVRSYGGIRTYREYLDEQNDTVPLWFIFLVFVLSWPFFLRRK